jgi:methyl-accepting chemotaxis protein
MLVDLISVFTPEKKDPILIWITESYVLGLICVFVIFGSLILVPILVRWIQLDINNFFIKITLKSKDASQVRHHIQDRLFKHSSWAIDAFREYRLAWEESRPQSSERAITPLRLKDYITPEITLESGRNRRIAEALPGIFVALGIFGTFLGLVLGLKGLQLSDLKNLKDGVGGLLNGLSLAFLTSLAGIALSVFFSLTYRFCIHRLERSLMALDSLLCQIFPYDSHERFARKYYEIQTDIKQGLQTLATDVATQITGSIAPKLSEALENHLAPLMEDFREWIHMQTEESRKQQDKLFADFSEHIGRLSKVITEHFENSQKQQAENMAVVLQHYSEALTQNFASQFENMGNVIKETTQVQAQIREQLIDFTHQLESQFQAQTELIEKTNRAGQILGQSLESLESIAQKLKNSAEDVTSAAQLLERSANSAKEGQEFLRETMKHQVETMAKTREELESTWKMVTESAQDMVDHIRETIKELSTGVGENMVKALDNFDGKVAEVVERFSGTLFETGQTIAELPILVAKLEDSLKSIGSNLALQKEILSDLKETTQDTLSVNVNKAVEASERFTESTENIAAVSHDLRSFLENFDNILKKNAEQLNQKSGLELLQRVGKLCDQIEGLGAVISKKENNGLNKINYSLLQKVGTIDERLVKIADSLESLRPDQTPSGGGNGGRRLFGFRVGA